MIRKAGRFGKLPKKNDYRTLRFADYLLKPTTPIVPAKTVDNIGRALANLGASEADIGSIFPMDGNDEYGDCTICGLAHLETLWDAFVKKRVIAPKSLVISTYLKRTGGADTGLSELEVLTWWRRNQFNGENILAFVSVDRHNLDHVKLAIEMFGAVYIGVQCTQEMEAQFNAQTPWTKGTLTNDGHCVIVPTYSETLFRSLTWGGGQEMDLDFWGQCVDEVYAPVGLAALLPGFSPTWNWSQLNANIRTVSN